MWTKIRTFGELQILTKASYVMLIFVPLLAGLWPAIKSGINRYNTAVIEARLSLDGASDRLEFIATTIEDSSGHLKEVSKILGSLQERLDAIIEEYSLKAIQKDSLPTVWALSFLASLSVMIAHFIYQATAPPLIKRITVLDYVNEALKAFVEHPSDAQLERAKRFSKHSEAKYEQSVETKESIYESASGPSRSMEEREREEERRKELGIIEKGAVGEYLRDAARSPLAAIACGLFYSAGLIILIYIISTQTIRVINAAWGTV